MGQNANKHLNLNKIIQHTKVCNRGFLIGAYSYAQMILKFKCFLKKFFGEDSALNLRVF